MNTRSKQNFDCDNELRAGCVIASLLTKYPEVHVRRSSSRRGYHVVVDALPDLIERWMIGDCFGRLHADMKRMKRGLPIGILFYYKNLRFASRWVRVRAIEPNGVEEFVKAVKEYKKAGYGPGADSAEFMVKVFEKSLKKHAQGGGVQRGG